MSPAAFESAIPASEQTQTHALDNEAAGEQSDLGLRALSLGPALVCSRTALLNSLAHLLSGAGLSFFSCLRAAVPDTVIRKTSFWFLTAKYGPEAHFLRIWELKVKRVTRRRGILRTTAIFC